MLKIQNIDKLLKRRIDPEWSVFEVNETSTSYIIQMWKSSTQKMQVMLERIPIQSKENEYELWCWNKQTAIGVTNTATPIRTMLKLSHLKDMDNLGRSIEFLTRDIRNNY